MALSLITVLNAPIIELDTTDSTNNYAMRLIDADTAQPGLTVIAAEQIQGKGQRGRPWKGIPGESLLMSIVIAPERSLSLQFLYNMSVAVAVVKVLNDLYHSWDVRIKWPNDIMINDKKAGGILLENVIRGSHWSFGIVGLGLNILHEHFAADLPNATSLKMASGRSFLLDELRDKMRAGILYYIYGNVPSDKILEEYNHYLYKRGEHQAFADNGSEWQAEVIGVSPQGLLQVVKDGQPEEYVHGTVEWVW